MFVGDMLAAPKTNANFVGVQMACALTDRSLVVKSS